MDEAGFADSWTCRFADLLQKHFEQAGLSLTANQIQQFTKYAVELKKWNHKFNLTRIIDDEAIITQHFLDSLCVLPWLPLADNGSGIALEESLEPKWHVREPGAVRVLDVGTGAGFPGIPLGIYRPDLRYTVLESIGKQVRFLHHLVLALELSSVEVLHGRAEEIHRQEDHCGTYDVVLTRYVASLKKSARYCLAFVKSRGYFIAYKGSDISSEVQGAEQTIRKYGGKVHDVHQVRPDRTLVLIQKE